MFILTIDQMSVYVKWVLCIGKVIDIITQLCILSQFYTFRTLI